VATAASAGMETVAGRKWVLALTSGASFMISLDSLVVATALPTIHRSLHASLSTLEWTVNAYNLTFAVLLLTGAALGDRFGRRRMFIVGLGIFTAASAACALSPSITALITARAAQGCGAALVMPLAVTQLSDAFPKTQRGKALGIFSGVTGLATLSGPLIGGAVAQGLAWQWIFWLNIPLGVITIILSAGHLRESHGPRARFDIGGVVLVTSGAFGVVWALVQANDVGWESGQVLTALVAGATLIAGFVVWEIRIAAPMLPMRFFRNRAFTVANASNFCLFASLYGTTFLLAQYLQNSVGYDPLAAGLRLVPWTAMLFIFAPVAGVLADKKGDRWFVAGGLILETGSLGWLAAIAAPHLRYASMLAPLITSGVGNSLAIPTIQRAVVGAVRPDEVGQASGTVNMLRILGGVFGIAVLGAVFTASGGTYASAPAFTAGFRDAMGSAALLAAVGALAALGIPAQRKPRRGSLAEAVPAQVVQFPKGEREF
jgi:EmrB/QacA subfamily drug resistance transporter